jgi:hypothetical protein
MQDTTVVCWGYNGYGDAGAAPSDPMMAPPTTVLVASGGAPLTNVVEVAAWVCP